jgi:hypothetical protein
MLTSENDYLCIGMCMADPDSGHCVGCGRPPPPVVIDGREVVAERTREPAPASMTSSASRFPDSPENH